MNLVNLTNLFETLYPRLISVILWFVSFGVCIYIRNFFDLMRNKLPELIKGRSKVQEKNMSCARASSFDEWKAFSENYSPMKFWLWLDYVFTKTYCRLWLFSDFIQTQKKYPTSLGKINSPTWKLFVTSS